MADVTRKRVGELVRGAFEVLIPHAEGLPAKTVLERMHAVVPATEFEIQDYPGRPGVRRYEKMVRFATIAPVKAGWLVKNKRLWTITDEGRTAYRKYPDPYQLTREAGMFSVSVGEVLQEDHRTTVGIPRENRVTAEGPEVRCG